MKCVNTYMCNTSNWDPVYFCHISKLINNMTNCFYKRTDNVGIKVKLRPVRLNTVATEKQKNITYYKCVFVAFVMMPAKRMSFIILSRMFCPAPTYYSTLSLQRHDPRENVIEHKIWFWFSLQMLSELFLILRIIQRDTIINVHSSSCKVPVTLVRF